MSPFRSRLVLSNLLILLLGFSLVVVVFSYLLAQRSTEVKQRDLQHQARLLALRMEQLYAGNAKPSQLSTDVDVASNILRERIIILSPLGRVVVDSARATPYFNHASYTYSLAALRGSETAQKVLQARGLIGFQSPIRGSNGHQNGGAVLLVAQVTDVQPTLSSLLPVILTAAIAAFLAWLLLAFYFTTSLLRPLARIVRATERMAAGDYKVRVPVQGAGEIALLGSRFNVMAGRVGESNQILRDFLANVSHDLRTPLTMIAGFSQALLDGTAEAGEVGEAATVINEEAGRMQQLVDDLLQLTRLESGLLRLEREPVDVRPFLDQVVARVEMGRLGKPQPAIENRAPAGLPPVDIDPERLHRALRNLIENAVQYTPVDGRVTVDARTVSREMVEISVADTGIGIDREDLPRIWERLYRTDKSREYVSGHSGLGLSIVREIVEAHGGSVAVESEPGRGSTFRVTVPRARGVRVRQTAEASDLA